MTRIVCQIKCNTFRLAHGLDHAADNNNDNNKHQHQHHHTSAVITAHGSAGQTISGSGCVCRSVVVQLPVWLDNSIFSGVADGSQAPLIRAVVVTQKNCGVLFIVCFLFFL